MILDGRSLPSDAALDCDICIVGGGIAGLAMARFLDGRGAKVVILESGGDKADNAAQALNRGVSNRPDYPFQASRARAFGGTSTRWTGACLRLEAPDFEPRDWIANSGWPIGPGDLAEDYTAAESFLGLAPARAFEDSLAASPLNGGDLEAQVVRYAQPLDLGRSCRRVIESSPNVTCILHATVTEVIPSAANRTVESIAFQVPGGGTHQVAARHVVLAGGGIENARLLLASTRHHANGLGNDNDMVGRYHMEHPIRCLAVLPVGPCGADFRAFTDLRRLGEGPVQGAFGLSAACRKRERLMNMHMRVYRYHRLEDAAPVIDAKAALFAPDADTRRAGRGRLGRHGARLVSTGVPYVAWHILNKIAPAARFDHVRLTAFVEQEPNPDNRITLSRDRDVFGQPLPHLQITESDEMQESILQTLVCMGRALSARGLPGLRYGPGAMAHLAYYDAYGLHQLGGTRMSDDPRRGVVDRNARVHGLGNLHVAGSSVFPTGGAANPTLTIVALSLRLARHLRRIGA